MTDYEGGTESVSDGRLWNMKQSKKEEGKKPIVEETAVHFPLDKEQKQSGFKSGQV